LSRRVETNLVAKLGIVYFVKHVAESAAGCLFLESVRDILASLERHQSRIFQLVGGISAHLREA
jgi:hypothetical protein